jgi:hypothetical protein
MGDEHDLLRRLKATNTLLVIVIVLLLGQAGWQTMQLSAVKDQLRQSQRALSTRVESMAGAKLQFPREELAAAVKWLDDFYRSPDGLQRPGGLVNPDHRPDGEAIGVWIVEVYLHARIEGATETEARQRVIDNIKGTDEWRAKHVM